MKCIYCEQSGGVLIVGEPVAVGIHGTARQRIVRPRYHKTCRDRAATEHAASRERYLRENEAELQRLREELAGR